jgi:hypothetical protein
LLGARAIEASCSTQKISLGNSLSKGVLANLEKLNS